jgi:hypothetical protein
MARWIPCGAQFVTGDVVRWVEPIWGPRHRKTGRSLPIGMRRLRAQVLECDEEWARLEIVPRGCILKAFDGYEGMVGKPLQGEIRRRRGPIGEGAAHRREWTDESARALVASRFLGPEPQAMAPKPGAWRPAGPRPGGGGSARTTRKGYGRGRKGPRTRYVPRGK